MHSKRPAPETDGALVAGVVVPPLPEPSVKLLLAIVSAEKQKKINERSN